jgi:ribosomal protein L11 methyltransferase
MYSLIVECTEAQAELLSAELWEAGACGVQEEDVPVNRVRLRGFFEEKPGLAQFAMFDPLLEVEPETDWVAETLNAWPAIEVGEKFFLAPPWNREATPGGRLRLTMHPGMAFGTGTHQATQLCLEAMEKYVQPGDAVLDLGTGTGILAAGALLLGAGRVAACDIDAESAAIAQRNLDADRMPAGVFAGSSRAVAARAADVVVANINGETHRALAAEYARIGRRSLILSGMTGKSEVIIEGFKVVERLNHGDWTCLVLCREEPS